MVTQRGPFGASHPDVLRIYGSVRTAHLERFRVMTPAAVSYRDERYDFDPSVAPADMIIRKRGRAATVLHLLCTEYRAVELNEPLMTGRWLDVLVQIAAIRLRDRLHRHRTRISAYCIGLTDPVQKLGMLRRVPARLARPWSTLVIQLIVRGMDRLAFGTDASMELVAEYAGAGLVADRGKLFPALPSICDCPLEPARDGHSVLFLGAFNERKGVQLVMAAWDERSADDLRLTLVGTGPLLDDVMAWAAGDSTVDVIVNPPRHVVHESLRRAHVLVLPSQRVGAWREQVGLPIVEGLAHGCEIITTDETGLARWLHEHGHRVVPRGSSASDLASAMVAAAASSRAAGDITASLPDRDRRTVADEWMLAPDPPGRDDTRAAHPKPTLRSQVTMYYASARRSLGRYGVHPARLFARNDARPVFVVGSPRSGTTFTAGAIGRVPGFADLGELRPLKQAVAALNVLPRDEAARRIRRIHTAAQRVGLVAGLRAVEQTPESTFLIPAIAMAFPDARFVHLVRDGRDVAASLLQLGWLRTTAGEVRTDEVGNLFGDLARFWVEPHRAAEFVAASEATRAAWVWRRYESTARQYLAELAGDRSLEIRYEHLVRQPGDVASKLARFLDAEAQGESFVEAFRATRHSASGRWRRDLNEVQLADIGQESGVLLAELGYVD